MARILCNVAGGGKPLKGNAETGDVLAGKTFSNKQSNALTGSMPNNGTNKKAVSVGGGSGSLWAYMPYGYYDNYNNTGNAWIDITDDQAKTLANNAGVGYNSGYTNGHNDGYNSGKSDGNKTYTIHVRVGCGDGIQGDQRADVTMETDVYFNPYTGAISCSNARISNWIVQYYSPGGQGVRQPGGLWSGATQK